MSDIVDFYRAQTAQALTAPWLKETQQNAVEHFTQTGFPTRQDEAWRYTSVDGFLKHRFQTAPENKATGFHDFDTILPNANAFYVVDGQLQGSPSPTPLPEGVIITSLAAALCDEAEMIKPYLGQVLSSTNVFQSLNMALFNAGFFIYVPKGVHINAPVLLHHRQTKASQAVHLRHVIVLEEGASATIIEYYEGENDCAYLSNAVTEVHLATQAQLTHYLIQKEGNMAFHMGHMGIKQQEKSQFDSHVLSMGALLSRRDMTLLLQEKQACALLNGVYMPNARQQMDHITTVMHEVADCKSNQDYKGIINGQAHAVFNGNVHVCVGADKSEAHQQNKNLLLSSQAEVYTKPALDIYADDVICSHGATVGQLDEEALFYMMARGIDKEDAIKYLIQAFASDNVRLVPHADIALWMTNLINEQLG